MGTDTATLAVSEIPREVSILICRNATFRAEYITDSTFDTLGFIPDGFSS